ncbi:MAG: carboxymuconolactone decarboxylase family protein [Alphaproteobacteria bacterium]|nr:carboxymuconolactone decarboxylase family protein [Alphaproteobacteria bacterium]
MSEYNETARVSSVTREAFPADLVEIYDHIMETRKLTFMADLFAMMGHSPGALEAVASVGEHVRFHSVLDEVLREMVICTVSQEVGNFYEWCHHIHRMPDDMREAVGTPAAEELPAPRGPALRFARQVANNEAVDDALVEEIRASLGDQGLVDLTVMVGYYQLIGTFCTTLHVPIEETLARPPFKK